MAVTVVSNQIAERVERLQMQSSYLRALLDSLDLALPCEPAERSARTASAAEPAR